MASQILSRTSTKPQSPPPTQNDTDFTVQNEGTIFLLCPLTQAASDWVKGHIQKDHTTFGGAVVVEHRYIVDLIDGIKNAGLTLA